MNVEFLTDLMSPIEQRCCHVVDGAFHVEAVSLDLDCCAVRCVPDEALQSHVLLDLGQGDFWVCHVVLLAVSVEI